MTMTKGRRPSRRCCSLLLLLVIFWSPCKQGNDCSSNGVAARSTNECETCASSSSGTNTMIVSNDGGTTTTMEFGEDMGVRQFLDDDSDMASKTRQVIQQARHYLQQQQSISTTTFLPIDKFRAVMAACKNQHVMCATWAAMGECSENPVYMNMSCAPVCQACEYMLLEIRCPMDPHANDAFYPGDVDRLFQRITTDPELARYEPTILSQPLSKHHANSIVRDTQELDPWIITMENLVSPEEAQVFIELGNQQGYEQSMEVGDIRLDGTAERLAIPGRSSSNAWCQNRCSQHETTKALMERIQTITGTNESNSEHLQILQYQPGQFYHTHHDYKHYQRDRPMGVRVLTILIYLNHVELKGGETNFPLLNITVTPKLGRAVIWPSVMNEDPNSPDLRTSHQSLPVIHGVKYAINAWIHQRDAKAAIARSCA